MRIFILSIGLILIPGFSALGQAPDDSRFFRGAVIAGINMSQIDGDNYAGYRKLGFTAGPKVFAMLSSKTSLSMALLYSQKGSASSINEASPGNSFKLTLNYVEIPIQFNFHDRERAILSAGLSYGRLVGTNLKIGGGTANNDTLADKHDLSAIADLNIIAKDHFGFNIRYGQSIIPIAHWNGSRLSRERVYSRYIGIRIMYLF